MWLLGGVGGRGIVCSEILMQGKEADLQSDLLLFFLSPTLYPDKDRLSTDQGRLPSVMMSPASRSILEVKP